MRKAPSLRCTFAAYVLAAACAAYSATAAPPAISDYAQGMLVRAPGGAPLVELELPDDVYQSVTRPDLRDLRVFNANGAPVPHAFCAAAETIDGAVNEASLPVFIVRAAPTHEGGGRIELETAGGARVNIDERTVASDAGLEPRTHIIDARGVGAPLRAIRFDWESPDGASQASVRIEASDDLDSWSPVVSATTLLRAEGAEQTLRRERIPLPTRRYGYLRVQRVDGGPPLVLRGVRAESVESSTTVEPRWIRPETLAAEEAHILKFDAARLAPVRFARLRLAQDNSSLNATLQSRADEKAPWRDRWSGEAYLVVTDAERRESAPARFEATTDRYWRVLLPKDAAAGPRPTLELGYYPVRVRFLRQGPGPYTLAFGSRRADPANPASCDGLLADVSAFERRGMIADGLTGELRTLGGEAALQPLPAKTPPRVIVLWIVLIAGVGLLVAMALALLRRVRLTGGG